MHIPDAVLSPSVAAATSIIGAGGLSVCSWKLRDQLRDRTTVLMGTMSAFVFAAQMVNFPLFPLPISGHLLGGVLVAVLLGPWAGAVVIGAVLIVQCLLFGDGGVTALGANFVNMGLIGAIGGYAIYAPIRRAIGGPAGVLIGGMVAAWFSVILASGAFAVELAASVGWSNFFNVLGWMALVHAGIGLGEALITGAVLRFVLLMRPDLIEQTGAADSSLAGRWGQVAFGRSGHRDRRGRVAGPVRFRARRWPGMGRRQAGFPERRGARSRRSDSRLPASTAGHSPREGSHGRCRSRGYARRLRR